MIGLLRTHRDFCIFLLTQATSNLGDSVRIVIMPLLVLQLSGSALLVSAMALLETVPYFLFHLPFGALLDRWDRRKAMLLADLGRGILVLSIPVIGLLSGPVLPSLFLIAVPLSILSSIFGAGSGALTPRLVDRGSITQAYSLFEAAESIAWVAGPIIAGALATIFAPANALILDGLSFFVSAIGLMVITVKPLEKEGEHEPVWTRIVNGLRFLLSVGPLRRIQLYWSIYGVIGYGAIVGLVYVGSEGGSAGPAFATFAVSSYAFGSLVGTVAAGRPLAKLANAIPLSLIAFASGALLVASNWGVAILGGAFLIGAGEGFFLVLYLARRAEVTSDAYMARIATTAALLARIATGISVTWMGLALEWWKGPGAFSTMALLALMLAAAIFVAGEIDL
jgi:DHA3 family macrolide efflux protein-like MFS transporter